MKRASVSQLKTSLSAYLLGVKNAEEVLVTERGRPIARFVTLDNRLADAARKEGFPVLPE